MTIINRLSNERQGTHQNVVYKFDFKNLLGDPFAIATLSIAFISWIIAIAGSISTVSYNENFPRFTWWGIVYQFLLMVLMSICYCYNLIDHYRLLLVGSLGVAFVYTTNSCTNLVYDDDSRRAAASAGFILLSIINLIWMCYFGGDNASPTNRWIDSFSLRGIRPSIQDIEYGFIPKNQILKCPPDHESVHTSGNNGTCGQSHHYVSSTALNGFENTGPNILNTLSEFNNKPINNHNENTYVTTVTNSNTESSMGDTLGLYSDVAEQLNGFPYTAKALYSYQADESDAYEISFEQGEILRVGDIEGRWWKAKKDNGDTGIIPSNYVELMDDITKS